MLRLPYTFVMFTMYLWTIQKVRAEAHVPHEMVITACVAVRITLRTKPATPLRSGAAWAGQDVVSQALSAANDWGTATFAGILGVVI